MSQVNWILEESIDRSREIAEARSQLAAIAAEQGVSPLSDVGELQGSPSPDDTGNDNVDDLLRLLREWNDDELARDE